MRKVSKRQEVINEQIEALNESHREHMEVILDKTTPEFIITNKDSVKVIKCTCGVINCRIVDIAGKKCSTQRFLAILIQDAMKEIDDVHPMDLVRFLRDIDNDLIRRGFSQGQINHARSALMGAQGMSVLES